MEHSVIPKRPREEEEGVKSEDASKRHKPYSHILSLLESDEDDPTQDLSPIITTLQQEITSSSSSSPSSDDTPLQQNPPLHNDGASKEEEEDDDDKERVMRHLLEASDDELGIPNTATGDSGLFDFGEGGFQFDNDGFSPSLCDGLWELEDETANYYTLLQSELFL